jgi:hypothetical protein
MIQRPVADRAAVVSTPGRCGLASRVELACDGATGQHPHRVARHRGPRALAHQCGGHWPG